MSALLPCPFCGGEANAEFTPPHHHAIAAFMPSHPGSWTIECHACGVGVLRDERPDAIAAWNRRATPAEVETLRAERDSMQATCRKLLEQVLERDAELAAVRAAAVEVE